MKTTRAQVFKCPLCGLVVEVMNGSTCSPVCCGEPMQLLAENTVDASREKHLPAAESFGNGVKVKVGSLPHPMEPEHYIEWIEVINGDYVNRCYLTPGMAPEAAFYVPMSKKLEFRAYCNKHGVWKS